MVEREGWRADKSTQAERLQTRRYQLFWSLQFSTCSLATMRMLRADQAGGAHHLAPMLLHGVCGWLPMLTMFNFIKLHTCIIFTPQAQLWVKSRKRWFYYYHVYCILLLMHSCWVYLKRIFLLLIISFIFVLDPSIIPKSPPQSRYML